MEFLKQVNMRNFSQEHKQKIKDTCVAVKRLEKMQDDLFECLVKDLALDNHEEPDELMNWLFEVVYNTSTKEEEDTLISTFARMYNNNAVTIV
jgi:hypothetical protein